MWLGIALPEIDSARSGMLVIRLAPSTLSTLSTLAALVSGFFVLLGPGAAAAHHLELSRLELRPVSGGVVTGRFLLAPKDVPSAVAASDDALLTHVRRSIALRYGEQTCAPELSVVERWQEGSPAPGHLVDLSCPFVTEEKTGPLVVRRAAGLGQLLVTYPEEGHTEEQALLLEADVDAKVPLIIVPPLSPEGTLAEPALSPPAIASTTSDESASRNATFRSWLILGFGHVLPFGLDHVLFVLALGLVAMHQVKTLTAMLIAFTVTHAVALYLAATEVVTLPAAVVEPAIALTIVIVAFLAAFRTDAAEGQRRLWPSVASALAFGLIHGAGFGSAFLGLGVPKGDIVASLVWFHVGVELGQLSVLVLGALLLFLVRRGRALFFRRLPEEVVIRVVAGAIGVFGLSWFFERL